MQRADIIRYWGRDNLRRWSIDDLRDVAIPSQSKSYLAEVGLPLLGQGTLRFDDAASRLPRLANRPNYRRIGLDYDVPICLDEERNGCVVEAGEGFGVPERYINANVELFGEFLAHDQQLRRKARAALEHAPRLIAAMERRMRKADPTAFSHEENWWAVIIEVMGYETAQE